MDNREKTNTTSDSDELRKPAEVHDLESRLKQTEEMMQNNQEELRNSTRWLKMFRDCNQAVVGAGQEFLLLHDICRIVVDIGGYQKAWVGYAQQDARKTVQPVAWAGYKEGFSETAHIAWADNEENQNPASIAIRSGAPHTSWHNGGSVIALPVISWETLGVLNIHKARAGEFDTEELQLLIELADILAYAISNLRIRAAHEALTRK